MRLWSIHPRYLDSKGLVALWREGLLAQSVLNGKTKGYRHHPQLDRFKKTNDPSRYLAHYLHIVANEASSRGYQFDAGKISVAAFRSPKVIEVTRGQLNYEALHLLGKLTTRDPARFRKLAALKSFQPHPLFCEVFGPIEPWERVR